MAIQKPDGIERIENEDTEAHGMETIRVEPGPDSAIEPDDTEGHIRLSSDDGEDTEGHRVLRVSEDEEDTEGHMVMRRPIVPGT